MTLLLWAFVAVYAMLFLNTLGNRLYTIQMAKRANTGRGLLPRISVVIPARNEAANLHQLLPSLQQQEYPYFEVLVYDDASEDETWEVIQGYSSKNLWGIRGKGPAPGWLGKPHALFQAAKHATGDILLFLDADACFLHKKTLSRLVIQFSGLPNRAYLSGLPKLTGGGLLLVSLVPFLITAALPMNLMRFHGFKSLSMLNGQFWMIRREQYEMLQPHEFAKDRILEDVEIGRYLKGQGMTPYLTDLKELLYIRMYDDFMGAWRGFRKNFYLVIGGGHPFLFGILWLGLTGLFVGAWWVSPWFLLAGMSLKALIDRFSGFSITYSLLAPVSFVLLSALLLDSAFSHLTGRVVWKGRHL
ncbi:MAG TPA: glycosyltransferase family 2 protein [Rhodothermales bacterium]|nr:glycosyl transferase family 2 [Bacteroidota bacterium]HRK73059.1 glycosyltransferase family 2 protein [Rhodothermales bacterium]HRR08463.1 glycosyltransferase family 2 protein [Rhodothermales bacterium]